MNEPVTKAEPPLSTQEGAKGSAAQTLQQFLEAYDAEKSLRTELSKGVSEQEAHVDEQLSAKDANGDLDEDAFRAVMEYNIQAGVHGFWIAGGTGESVLIEDEENKRMAEIAAELNKEHGGKA